jgi:hypothetical protein
MGAFLIGTLNRCGTEEVFIPNLDAAPSPIHSTTPNSIELDGLQAIDTLDDLLFLKVMTNSEKDESESLAVERGPAYTSLINALHHNEAVPGLTDPEIQDMLGPKIPATDPVCGAGWTYYTYNCFREGRSPKCGVEQEEINQELIEYNGCSHPSFGQSGMKLHDNIYHGMVYDQELLGRNWCKDHGKDLEKEAHEIAAAALRGCKDRHQRLLNEKGLTNWKAECQLLHRVPDLKEKSQKQCFYDKKRKNSYVRWSGHVVTEEPAFVYRSQDPLCGRKLPAQSMRIQPRIYRSCRLPEFGREATNLCGAPLIFIWTDPGLKRSELNSDHFYWRERERVSAECTTCDDIAYQTDAQIQTKIACLQKQWVFFEGQKQQAANRGDLKTLRKINNQAMDLSRRGATLFESHYLPRTDGSQFLDFYKQTSITAKGLVDIDTHADFQARTHLCLNLLQSHVNPRRIVSEFNDCLALASLQDNHQIPQDSPDEKDNGLHLVMRLFGRYIQASSVMGSPNLALHQASRAMIHSWLSFAVAQMPQLSKQEIENLGQAMRVLADSQFAKYSED